MSDRLAKAFDRHLAAALENDKPARTRLLKRGWKQFVTTDRPETASANEMAVAAIMYIGVEEGAWVKEPRLIQAAISFASLHHDHKPDVPVPDLAKAIDAIPVDKAKVRDWFDRAFPTLDNTAS